MCRSVNILQCFNLDTHDLDAYFFHSWIPWVAWPSGENDEYGSEQASTRRVDRVYEMFKLVRKARFGQGALTKWDSDWWMVESEDLGPMSNGLSS